MPTVTARLSDDDNAVIQAYANMMGMSVSDVFRDAMSKFIREMDFTEIDQKLADARARQDAAFQRVKALLAQTQGEDLNDKRSDDDHAKAG